MPNDAIGGSGAAELDREIHSTGNSSSSLPRHRTDLRDKHSSRERFRLQTIRRRSAHKIDKILGSERAERDRTTRNVLRCWG
jgi:hypothetical protein